MIFPVSYYSGKVDYEKPGFYWKNYIRHECDLSLLQKVILNKIWSPIVWKDGIRKKENFVECDLAVFDFDDDVTIAECVRRFCDTNFIIATTKSHQVWKHSHPPCDRFRLIIPFAQKITDFIVYEYNMEKAVREVGADHQCVDAARWFYPCTSIRTVNIGQDLYLQDVDTNIPLDYRRLKQGELEMSCRVSDGDKYNFLKFGHMPAHLTAFLVFGKEFGGGRNISCYSAAIFLLDCGVPKDQVVAILKDAPFDRKDFKDSEIKTAVESAFRRLKCKTSMV